MNENNWPLSTQNVDVKTMFIVMDDCDVGLSTGARGAHQAGPLNLNATSHRAGRAAANINARIAGVNNFPRRHSPFLSWRAMSHSLLSARISRRVSSQSCHGNRGRRVGGSRVGRQT